MWVVVEYTDKDENRCCWAVPESWINTTEKCLHYPEKDWMKQRRIVTYPKPSWTSMKYDKIVFNNIGRLYTFIKHFAKIIFNQLIIF